MSQLIYVRVRPAKQGVDVDWLRRARLYSVFGATVVLLVFLFFLFT